MDDDACIKVRKWRLEQYPTDNPMPTYICPIDEDGKDCFSDSAPLITWSGLHETYKGLVDEHNNLVIEYLKLKKRKEQ